MKNENVGSTQEQWKLIINALNIIDGETGIKKFNALSTPAFECQQCRNERLLHYPFNKKGIIPA